MKRKAFLIMGTAALNGCMVQSPEITQETQYACAATQSCVLGKSCEPSNLEFNLSNSNVADLVLNFGESSVLLTYVETTTAMLHRGAVSLETYASDDAKVRVTLGLDGSSEIRTRLELFENNEARNISATCRPLPEHSL